MFKKVAAFLFTISFAFFILLSSVLRASSSNYSFYEQEDLSHNGKVKGVETESGEINIKYFFPYPGKIHPDNSLWYFKALRDKLWFTLTSNSSRKAELLLLFADKRLVSSKYLFEKGKSNIAFSTLTKAEKYLEKSSQQNLVNREKGIDTTSFELKLANASLKHREEILRLLNMCPEDMKPETIKVINYSKKAYVDSRDSLLSKGVEPPFNPFNGE